MTSTETPVKPDPPADDQGGGWGAMDTLGVIAGCLLVVIVADILTDGRVISRRLRGQPKQPEAEVPSE